MGRLVKPGISGQPTIGALTTSGTVGGNNVTLTTISGNTDITIDPAGSGITKIVGNATGSGTLTLDNALTVKGGNVLQLQDTDDSNYIQLKANGTTTSNYTLTFPAAITGVTGYALTASTGGALSWSQIGVTITDGDGTSATIHYPLMSTSSSGTISGVTTVSSKLTFQPSTGKITCTELAPTTISGNVNFSGVPTFLAGIRIQEMIEDITDASLSGNAATFDYTTGNIFFVTSGPSGSMTYNFTNVPTTDGRVVTFNVFQLMSTTSAIPTTFNINGSSASVRWQFGITPTGTGTSNKIDVYSFTIIRRSTAFTLLGAINANF